MPLAVGKLLGQERLQERIDEIKKIIEPIDFGWDMGFMKQEEYIQKREKLKAQLAELQPIPQDELIEAHRMLKEFPERWEKGNAEERQRLLNMILCRVWVLEDHVCALMLRPCYFVVIHEEIAKDSIEEIEPSERPRFLQKENGNFRNMGSCRCGSDGIRLPSGNFLSVILVAAQPPESAPHCTLHSHCEATIS